MARRAAARSIWEPRGWQIAAFECPVSEVLYEGGRGGGKTDTPLAVFGSRCGLGFGPAWAGVIWRRQHKELEDVMAKATAMFTELPASRRPRYRGSPFYGWTWPTGETLMFRHMRVPADYWGFHGWSKPFMWFDELTTWPTPECYDLAKTIWRAKADPVPCPACTRSGEHFNEKRGPGCEFCRERGELEIQDVMIYGGSTNPHGVGHNWVKRRFVDPGPERTIIRMREEVHLPDAEGVYSKQVIHSERVRIYAPFAGSALAESDPGYLGRTLAKQPEHIQTAWAGGDDRWDITSGGMFDDLWDRGIHAIPSFEIPKSWALRRAFDWGSAKPFSYGLWAVADGTPNAEGWCPPKGTLIRVREFYGTEGEENKGLRWTSKKLGQEFRKREKAWGLHGRIEPGPADTSIWDTEHDGSSVADELKKFGIKFTKADKRSRVNGWERCRSLIEASLSTPMEEPGLFVFERENPHFLRTVPTAQRDDDNLDDLDTETEDHIADEMRYMVMSAKPVKVRTKAGGIFDQLRK